MTQKSVKCIEQLNYREWQARNSNHFDKLSRKRKIQIKNLGYKNTGWGNVQNSWNLLKEFEFSPDTHTLLTFRRESLIRDKNLSSEDYAEGLSSLFKDSLAHVEQVLEKGKDLQKRLEKLKKI